MSKIWKCVFTAAAALILACGGDSSSKADNSAEISVASYDDLPNCTENREGMEATTEDGGTYVCTDGEWKEASGPITTYETLEDMPNCTAKREGETAYVEEDEGTYVCTDGEWTAESPESSGSSSSKGGKKDDDGDEDGDGDGSDDGEDNDGDSGSSGESSSGAAPSSSSTAPVIITDGKTVDGSCYPDRSLALKNDTVTWYFARAILDSTASASDIVAYHVLINGTDCAWTLTGASKSSVVVKCSKSSVAAVYSSTGNYTASIKAGENTITCSGVRVVNEYPSSSSEVPSSSSVVPSSSSAVPSSSSVEPESSSEEESSSSEEPSSSSWEKLSSQELYVSSSGGSEEPESSNEGNSSGSVGSSGSVNPVSSDASVYDSIANTLTDLRDGQVYRTTTINVPAEDYSKVWMAENLNYRYLGPTADEDSSSFCYDNDPANCTKYGRLYLWSAAMDSAGIIKGNTANGCGYYSECSLSGTVRGVCPKGWHLPSEAEWSALFTAVGGKSAARTKLKSASGWNSSGNGTDDFGFSALPAGYRYENGSYYGEGKIAYFWSSSFSSSTDNINNDYADRRYLYYNNDPPAHDRSNNNEDEGYSVRCLKD